MNHKSEYRSNQKQIAECEQALKIAVLNAQTLTRKGEYQSMALCLLSLFIRKMIV